MLLKYVEQHIQKVSAIITSDPKNELTLASRVAVYVSMSGLAANQTMFSYFLLV